MLCRVAGKEALSLSKETLCFGVSFPTEPSDSLTPDASRCARIIGDDSTDDKGIEFDEVAASRLRWTGRAVPRTRFRFGDDWRGNADNLSELVSFEDDDSESKEEI